MRAEIATRLHQMRLVAALRSAASYGQALRAGVRGLWSGTYNQVEFFDAFEDAIRRHFREAWGAGMAEAGMSLEDMNLEERLRLEELIWTELGFVFGFADDISAATKAGGFPLQPHLDRVEKWVARYNGIKAEALQRARTDPVLAWETHADESCESCLKLSGQRRRASVWKRLDLRPQSLRLECMKSAGGVPVCQCTLNVTDLPPTRGRVPKV